ncbi:MAG: proline--tRNA ligase [Myxococcales bacterium]|nr:proline--tRNA ligase [Myxococcales bacterium]
MADKLIPREKGFSEWYVDLVQKAKLADYSDVKGCMVIRPNGFALWESIQRALDKMFKDTGHRNAYFPLLIPLSYLKKEAEHVEGFNPQLALVTVAGGKQLEEPYAIRPTSETIINATFAKWIQSYRDLPLLINQWCNVMRWEMRTRLFLRTTEFLWQEGHTCHETEEEAERETRQMLEIYRTFAEEHMAMPVLAGRKSESERFAGALRTYSIEAMMQDKKALQAGTSHNLGQNFAKAFNTQFLGRDGQQHYVWQTSWGVSTRLIGGLILTHSDDSGLVVPPKLAASHVVIIVIGKGEERARVVERAQALAADLRRVGLGVSVDDDESKSPGFKYFEYELQGVCLRVELGPKDLAKEQCVMVRRDTRVKEFAPLSGAVARAQALLESMQKDLFARAKQFRDEHTFEVNTYDELKARADDGFMLAHWCEKPSCEAKVKEDTSATTRCRPFALEQVPGKCVVCGEPSPGRMVVAKAY